MSIQEMPLKLQLMIVIGILITGLIAFELGLFTISYFDLGPETSLISGFRTLLMINLPPILIPLIVLGEFINKEWKRRKFRWRNVGVAISISTPFFALTLLLLTICDILFSQLSFVWQLPLMTMCGLIG